VKRGRAIMPCPFCRNYSRGEGSFQRSVLSFQTPGTNYLPFAVSWWMPITIKEESSTCDRAQKERWGWNTDSWEL